MQIKTPKNLTEAEKLNWIRLSRSENIGPSTFFRLLEIFQTPTKALERLPEFAAKISKCKLKICTQSMVDDELSKVKKYGAEMITFADECYPRLLREIYDPAPVLTIFGRKDLLNQDSMAIIGPRNATFHACAFAKTMAQDLGQNQITIVSGLAKGIDAAAHRGALKTGTVAVIAGGINDVYPAENAELYKQIRQEGVIISEQIFDGPPKGGNFIQRNRIISGMSYGVVVVEASMQSGSLATARFALEQGREVFAVPGFPTDPRCHGSNLLLEDGAIFTQGSSRVLREMPALRARFSEAGMLEEPDSIDFAGPEIKFPSDSDIAKVREEILQKIGFMAISIEEIIVAIGASARLVNIALVQLELAEKVAVNAGRVVRR